MILQVWLRHKSSSKKALQAALGLLEEHRFDEAKNLLRRLVEIQPPAGASRSSVWYISGEERFTVPANCRVARILMAHRGDSGSGFFPKIISFAWILHVSDGLLERSLHVMMCMYCIFVDYRVQLLIL